MFNMAMVIVFCLAFPVLRTYWRQIRIQCFGTETNAYISWTEKAYCPAMKSCDDARYYCYCCYARFVKEDGQEAEAKLINGKKRLITGSRIKIKYLPEKDNEAVLTDIIRI